MNTTDLSVLDALTEHVPTITASGPDPQLDIETLAERWLQLRQAHRQLGVLINEYETIVGSKLDRLDYDPTEGYEIAGERIHHSFPSTDRWQGRQLLSDLGIDVVDRDTGEQLRAVPVEVLTQIVPGTGSDELTSSSWSVRGLHNLGVDPTDYRTREWKPPKARYGVKRR